MENPTTKHNPNIREIANSYPAEYGYISPKTIDRSILGVQDGFAHIGVKFRWNLLSQRAEIRWGDDPWELLDDHQESLIFQRIAEECIFRDRRKESSDPTPADFTTRISTFRQAILSRALQLKYHPLVEYLESLPEWDGEERISTMCSDNGMTLDAGPFQEWAESYLIIEAIRFALWPESPRRAHPVLMGKPNEGKSAIAKALMPPSMPSKKYVNDGFSFCGESREMMEKLKGFIFVEGAEGCGIDSRNPAMIQRMKSWLTQMGYGSARGVWERHPTTALRGDVVYFTTNKAIISPGDPALDTRLIHVKVTGTADRKDGKAFNAFSDPVDPDDPHSPTYLEMLWAEGLYKLKKHAKDGKSVTNPFITDEMLEKHASSWNARSGGHYQTEESSLMDCVREVIDSYQDSDGTVPSVVDVIKMQDDIRKCWVKNHSGSDGYNYNERQHLEELYNRSYKVNVIRNIVSEEGTYRYRLVKRCRKNSKRQWGYYTDDFSPV